MVDQHRASITWLESLSELERKKHSEIVALSGAVLLILSVVLVDETWVFPGWIACLPTLGTGLVIGGPIMALEGESTRTNQVIGNKLFAFVGRISYPSASPMTSQFAPRMNAHNAIFVSVCVALATLDIRAVTFPSGPHNWAAGSFSEDWPRKSKHSHVTRHIVRGRRTTTSRSVAVHAPCTVGADAWGVSNKRVLI